MVNELIDYEAIKWINITILASDNAKNSSKQSILKFNCKIEDMNDNRPIFDPITPNSLDNIFRTYENFNSTISYFGNITVRIKKVI